MAEPELIEAAAELADYMVTNELSALDSITFEDTNGDIRYIPVAQERFNLRYDYILNLLEKTAEDRKYVISLYDYTGEALKPWAKRYICFAYDIQHTEERTEMFDGGGRIHTSMLTCITSGHLMISMNTLILSGQIMAQIIGCTLYGLSCLY